MGHLAVRLCLCLQEESLFRYVIRFGEGVSVASDRERDLLDL